MRDDVPEGILRIRPDAGPELCGALDGEHARLRRESRLRREMHVEPAMGEACGLHDLGDRDAVEPAPYTA